MWNTICLPFDIPQEQWEGSFGENNVYEYTNATGNYQAGIDLELTPLTSNMLAQTAYLIYPNQDIVNPLFENVQLVSFTNPMAEGNDVKIQGTLQPTEMTQDNTNTLMVGANNTVFYPSVSAPIRAFRAYFEVETYGQFGGRRLSARLVIRQSPTTATDLMDNTTIQSATDKYIENGMLIIERNGIRYNAQGAIMQ